MVTSPRTRCRAELLSAPSRARVDARDAPAPFCCDSGNRGLFGRTGAVGLPAPSSIFRKLGEVQPSQQEVSSAICGFTASARLSISSLEAGCSLWLSTARMALLPRCADQMWHESHMPPRAFHPLQGHWDLFLCLSLLSTHLSPLGNYQLRVHLWLGQ